MAKKLRNIHPGEVLLEEFLNPMGISQNALARAIGRSEEHTSELQSLAYLVCRLLLEKKKKTHPLSSYEQTDEKHILQLPPVRRPHETAASACTSRGSIQRDHAVPRTHPGSS